VRPLNYEDKIKILIKNKIGLWDVIKSGYREGSLDSNIKDEEFNDFSNLRDLCPNLKLISFNGKKAGEYESVLKDLGFKTLILPSSSGANRRNNEKRIEEWTGMKSKL